MALTAEIMQSLKAKKFPELYESHKEKWNLMARDAETYVDKWVPKGERIRAPDIANQLVDPLRVDADFVKHVDEKTGGQKYWSVNFADYIVDQMHGAKIVKRVKK
jgi:hypothetical protein